MNLVPFDPIMKLTFMGYVAPDEKTAVITIKSTIATFYLALLSSHILFLVFILRDSYLGFLNASLAADIVVFVVALVYGWWSSTKLVFSSAVIPMKKILSSVLLIPLAITPIGCLFFWLLPQHINHSPLNWYLVFVLLHGWFASLLMICISQITIAVSKILKGQTQ